MRLDFFENYCLLFVQYQISYLFENSAIAKKNKNSISNLNSEICFLDRKYTLKLFCFDLFYNVLGPFCKQTDS